MRDLSDIPSLADIGLGAYPPYLMNRIMGRYNASLRAEMAGLGLSIPKMRALAVLSTVESALVGELADLAIAEQSTMSRALDGLAAEGLVARAPDAADSRATRVSITEAGRAAFARLWPHMAAATEAMFAGIEAQERAAFVRTLGRILGNVHPV